MATKKVVKATSSPTKKSTSAATDGSASVFTPTAQAKKKAGNFRIIAAVLWVLAIGLEAFAAFWLLNHTELKGFLVWLIAAIVVIGVLAVVGSQLWKKANQLDPASKKEPVRFFIQNQLGAIITIIAFVPLIILIFLNKGMDKKQKTIAGVVGIVVLVIAELLNISWNSPSQEQRNEQLATVMAYTGEDKVYWVSGGSVYHLCAEHPAGTTIPPLARGDVETNDIYEGTVAQAVEAGKNRLSMYGFTECGYTEGEPQFPEYLEDVSSDEPSSPDSTAEQTSGGGSADPTDSPT